MTTFLFDFERLDARRHALIALLAIALLSPDIPMPSPSPAVRLEQVLLGILLPSLFLYYRRHPEVRRALAVDFAFLGLAVAVTATLIGAPLFVSKAEYSIRDPFELAKVVEYWLMFRIAYIASPGAATGSAVRNVFLLAAIGLGLFAFVQYLDLGSFNEAVTDIWADAHNLEGVTTRSRIVATAGNANYAGIIACWFLIFALSMVLLRQRMGPPLRWTVIAAACFAALAVVMSQSRTAVIALVGALVLGLIFVAVTWRGRANYLGAIALFLAAATVSVTFVEVVQPEFGTFHQRFSPNELGGGRSSTVRLQKWRSLLGGFFQERPEYCEGLDLDDKVGKGHAPASAPGAPAPAADALARDAQRKQDVRALARAGLDYFCEKDRWPYREPSLAEALVPRFLDPLPADPATGLAYPAFVVSGDFLVGAPLENEDDPEGPYFALGTPPNIVRNPSFEDGRAVPANWALAGGESGGPAPGVHIANDGLFGARAAHLDLGPEDSLYQLVVFEFPLGQEWTATMWARSDSGKDEDVRLYMIALLAEGGELDPFAAIAAVLPANGQWVPVSLTFTTTESSRTFVMQFSIRAGTTGERAKIAVDGATLTAGSFAPSFPWVIDVDPARLKPPDVPAFADSPIIGIGPRKGHPAGSFDNEYILFLNRYGGLGALAYLGLLGSAFVVAFQARKSAEIHTVVLSLTMLVFIVALAVFNIAAGSYYAFQVMAVYWLLIGVLARARPGAPPGEGG